MKALVCDSGTGYLKLGWSDQTFPQHIIPSLVGKPLLRSDEKIGNVELKSIMIGDEAAPLRSYLELSHPLEEGKVTNWEDLTLLWDYAFSKKVNCDPTQTSVLMTEAVLNPDENRKKMIQICFETFKFQQMQIGVQALLSLFAEGLMTAMLLDSGDGVTHCIPVVEGNILKHQIKRMNIAGRHITNYLIKLLFLRGYAFNSTADFETVREVKEKYCFVSTNLDDDRKLSKQTTALEIDHKLPDNTRIRIGRERFEAPELLFQPFKEGYEFPGCSEMVFDSINDCPIDLRKQLYQSIMISGGTSTLPGFPTRLETDVKKLYLQKILKNKGDIKSMKTVINVIDPPRRKYNVFIGGCVYVNSVGQRPDFWITKQEYEEIGENVIKKAGSNMHM